MRQDSFPDCSLSAIGGVERGDDAAEFILLGANTVQVGMSDKVERILYLHVYLYLYLSISIYIYIYIHIYYIFIYIVLWSYHALLHCIALLPTLQWW